MPKHKKVNPSNLYQQRGATFAVPLTDGRYGACRVLWVRREAKISLFAATQYIGTTQPELSNPLLRSILVMNSLGLDNWPCVLWQYWGYPPPADFRYVGVLEPTPAEERMNPDAFSKFWDQYPDYILQEWRWQHDRRAFISEYEQEHGVEAVRRLLDEKKRTAAMTPEKLRKQRFFTDWEGEAAPSVIRESRKIMRDTINGLIALGRKPTKKLARPILRQCIERFNRLDEKHNHFICTIEREDICDRSYELIRVARLRGCDQLADEWREW